MIAVEGRATEVRDRAELLAFLDAYNPKYRWNFTVDQVCEASSTCARNGPSRGSAAKAKRSAAPRRAGDSRLDTPRTGNACSHRISFATATFSPRITTRAAVNRCCWCTVSPVRSSTSTTSCEWFTDRHRVLAPDQRGHGESSNFGHADAYSFDILVEDLAGFLDALDVQRCHLLGHSMGGMVAMRFALRYPERLTSLILMDTAAEPLTIFPQALREQLAKDVRAQRLREPREDDARNADERRTEARRRFPRRRRTLAPHRTEVVADGPRGMGRPRRPHGEAAVAAARIRQTDRCRPRSSSANTTSPSWNRQRAWPKRSRTRASRRFRSPHTVLSTRTRRCGGSVESMRHAPGTAISMPVGRRVIGAPARRSGERLRTDHPAGPCRAIQRSRLRSSDAPVTAGARHRR